MSKAFLKHDLKTLALSPATPVFLSFAWVAASLAAFYLGGFFLLNEASATALFSFLPWVFVLMLPALTMGLWAEDFRKGTAERLFTLPIAPHKIVLTRFVALWLLVGLFLLGTWPFVATLFWLGSPAVGPLLSGYLGVWLLGGTLLSASLAASAASRSFVTAFGLGVAVCLMLVLSGWASMLGWLSGVAPAAVVNALREASLMEHIRTFILGQINVRSVVYFLTLTAIGQLITYVLIARRLQLRPSLATRAGQGAGGLALVALAVLAMVIPGRVDTTPEKLYTLAPQTINLLRQLPKDTELLIYSSENNPAVPASVRRMHRHLMDILGDMNAASGGKLPYRIINTDRGIAQELAAVEDDIKPMGDMSQNGYYYGLSLNTGGRKVAISNLSPAREAYLEFDLASLISASLKTEKKTLGILLVPELATPRSQPQFLSELEGFYDLLLLRPGVPDVPPEVDALIVLPAPYYPEETLYAVNKYLQRGGHAMILLDPFFREHPDDFPNVPDRNADAFAMDHMADVLRKYGVTYEGQQIVADVSLAAPVEQDDIGYTNYPLWLRLSSSNINTALPFTGFVDTITMAEAGHLTFSPTTAGLSLEPVFSTSENGQVVGRAMVDALVPQAIPMQIKSGKAVRHMAALLSGSFPNVYPTLPATAKQFYEDFTAQSPENRKFIPPHPAAAQGQDGAALLVIADMDMFYPRFALNRSGTDAANDNLVFFFNSLGWLMEESDLLAIRGKGLKPRTFTRIENMMRGKALEAQRQEQILAAELYDVSSRLQQLRAKGEGEENSTYNQRVMQELATYANREFTLQAGLRQIRRDLSNEVTRMGHLLALFSAFTMPVLLMLISFLYRRRQRRAAG
ncbi:MAG: hypothetical protein COY40_01215 [Alphaproteobacteria bacterium CG_4_10_14_0_8_um_filter_53_9]|nr:MAG: hypothetical protein COY40_01215 [Alphaproteobacteria bacterium CG_4_10_14_0_8_um_filter_53_9]